MNRDDVGPGRAARDEWWAVMLLLAALVAASYLLHRVA